MRSVLKAFVVLALLYAPVLAADPVAPAAAPKAADALRLLIEQPPRWVLEVQLPDKSIVRVDSASPPLPCETASAAGAGRTITWARLGDGPLADLSVTATADGDRLRLAVANKGKAVALREITFPIVDLPVTDADTVVIPAVSGRLHRRPATNRLDFKGEYPGGWLPMQCAGFYGPGGGVYVGVHDPFASTKRLEMETKDGRLRIAWKWPAPGCGVPGGAWEMPGAVVVRPFDGDWFDLAMLYRDWASKEAAWWPRGSQAGRPDTPAWLKDVAVWGLVSGESKTVVPQATKFAQYLGVPTAVHWYNWHVIPFDNDYPHYFPAKDGFAEGVKQLQAAGVRVMPYINGRLWDTDLEDFKTAGIAAATKDEAGKPYTEEYGSKQKLAPMCPTTPLWQKTVRDIVMRLTGPEFNVDGVYIDQIAAASPRLCFDRAHGHPLAGGCWWNVAGYWPMLTDLRKAMAAERPGKMITTECNAEPFVRFLDGYLTWHFQEDDAVPLFAAVYGGQVQTFSRAYQDDSWKGLAMRQKTAQALTWGEQLGWMGPEVVDDPVAGPFLKRLGRLRYDLRRYFADGRLARPPAVAGDGATLTADWKWGGKRIVTTPAVLAGAWQAPGGAVALVFVNVDEKPHALDLHFDGARYGLAGNLLVRERTGLEARDALPPEAKPAPLTWDRRIALDPLAALTLEVVPAPRP